MAIKGKLNSLTIEFNGDALLQEVHAEIPGGKCIGVVGANGSGKSSLLNVLAAGDPAIQWLGCSPSIAYMKQEVKEPDLACKMLEHRKLEAKWNVPQVRSKLSGGETMKARLAKVLAEKAEVLLLDEPTNHLDEESVWEVIRHLKNYSGTIFVVSHDRHFLDEVATCIWEIEDKKLEVYEGNYCAYREQKEHRQLTLQRKYDKQQAKIDQVGRQISELQSWSGKAHADSTKQEGFKEFYRSKAKRMDVQVKSKRKRLEAELAKERISQPKVPAEVKFDIDGGAKQGKRVIELKAAGKVFGGKTLFEKATFTILHGERIGLVGKNGSGKSTFFNILRKEEGCAGEVWMTRGMRIGYLSQDVYDLPEEKTPAELFGAKALKVKGASARSWTILALANSTGKNRSAI